LHQELTDPWIDYNQRQELTPGLLRANKTVHREASSLFYAQSRFDFTMATPEDVALFLGTIGRNNADYIRLVMMIMMITTLTMMVTFGEERGTEFIHAHD